VPKYLLDTNILSEVVKKRPSPTVLRHLRDAPQSALHTSVVSVMEMRFGAVRSAAGSILWERIRRDVLARVKILPLGEDEASRAGEILADLELRGTPVGIEGRADRRDSAGRRSGGGHAERETPRSDSGPSH